MLVSQVMSVVEAWAADPEIDAQHSPMPSVEFIEALQGTIRCHYSMPGAVVQTIAKIIDWCFAFTLQLLHGALHFFSKRLNDRI